MRCTLGCRRPALNLLHLNILLDDRSLASQVFFCAPFCSVSPTTVMRVYVLIFCSTVSRTYISLDLLEALTSVWYYIVCTVLVLLPYPLCEIRPGRKRLLRAGSYACVTWIIRTIRNCYEYGIPAAFILKSSPKTAYGIHPLRRLLIFEVKLMSIQQKVTQVIRGVAPRTPVSS